jgi:hypothetical protein
MRRKICGMKFTDASHNRRRLFVGILGILIVDPFHPSILSLTFLFVTEVKVLGILRAVLVPYSPSSLASLTISPIRTMLTNSSHIQGPRTPTNAAYLRPSRSYGHGKPRSRIKHYDKDIKIRTATEMEIAAGFRTSKTRGQLKRHIMSKDLKLILILG